MFDVFLAEVLILLLLITLSGRIFFTKRARLDSTAVLAPVAFFFAVLLLYTWGAYPGIIAVTVLSFFALILNVRSLLRVSARLIVDHYNVRFIIPSVLIFLLSIAMLVFIVVCHPVRYAVKNFGVTRTRSALTGSFVSDYQTRSNYFDRTSITGVLYAYEPESSADVLPADSADERPVILFVPKATATVMQYEPYFLMLAQKGYRVLSADFYSPFPRLYGTAADTRFFRRLYSLYLYFFERETFDSYAEQDERLNLFGYRALSSLALQRYGDNVPLFYATDAITSDASLAEEFAQNNRGSFAINRIAEYKTSGMGFLEQNDTLLGIFLGIHRDETFFIPRYVAGKTIAAIEELKKLSAPIEIIKGE